ncbi:MAG: hypothetical protein DI555_06975 [Novosphingobium pentaromativorans]|uniref:Uncharacterized protein n=1 Tax=Novosphingobium pentaromativorans TaxID=205844 RepID=A0A2W5NQF0_9SPHN|nr:MAG: hypothetical protein DI555_06975 [Novosphingobium pentaromativorans]
MLNNDGSTQKGICSSPLRVGRKMRYPEKREAAFAEGTLARIQRSMRDDETQVAFIREAVERELERREGRA